MLKTLANMISSALPKQASAVSVAERRRSPRIDVQLGCEAYLRGHEQMVVRSQIRNVTIAAIGIETPFPVRIGDELIVNFSLLGTRVDGMSARVIWAIKTQTGYRCGVTFESQGAESTGGK